MPVAVIQESNHKFDLKSLPEGYVVIREMTYGERLMRQGLSGKMKLIADQKSEYAGEVEMATKKLALWDFANLIIEHNLDDLDGRRLNFKLEHDVNKLSSRIGEEVGTYIDKVNSFEDIEEGNS